MNNLDPKSDNLRERIANGECVSPMTVERCPVCIDRCEAAHWRMELSQTIKDTNVKPPIIIGHESDEIFDRKMLDIVIETLKLLRETNITIIHHENHHTMESRLHKIDKLLEKCASKKS